MQTVELTPLVFHRIARSAVDSMIHMVNKHRRTLTEFTEAQLVHEIGQKLIARGYWVGFEHKYHASHGQYGKRRADIMALNGLKGSDKSHVWIEIKSTGLNDLGQLNNSFRYLFQKDFSALRRDNKIGSSDNYCYWAWMYLFDYAREKVESHFGSPSSWKSMSDLDQLAQILGSTEVQYQTLGKTLMAISRETRRRYGTTDGARASIMSAVP